MTKVKLCTLLVILGCLAPLIVADITTVNDLVIPTEIYDFTYSTDSSVNWQTRNRTRYYCIFRSLWTEESSPNNYPRLARFGDMVVYSSTKEFRPWLKGAATTFGIEKIAETGFTDAFKDEIVEAGLQVLNTVEGDGFFINQTTWKDNYVFIPPVEVSFDYPFLNGISAVQPSPDWFTGFYLFNTVDEYDRTFWKRFTLNSFPWDAGTDSGQTYTSPDSDTDPPEAVARIFKENAPSDGAFLSEDGQEVAPLAQWDCELYVCPLDDPFCERPDWPPVNYCDILKYPDCANYCDPATTQVNGTPVVCQECRGNGYEPKIVNFTDCCATGHDPRHGPSCEALAAMASGAMFVFVNSLRLALTLSSGIALFNVF